MTTQLSNFLSNIMHERYSIVIRKELVAESFAVTDMTAVTSAVLFRSGSKGSGFHLMKALNFQHYSANVTKKGSCI